MIEQFVIVEGLNLEKPCFYLEKQYFLKISRIRKRSENVAQNHEKRQKSTKSTKINEKSIETPLKQSITSTADRQRAPGTSGVL